MSKKKDDGSVNVNDLAKNFRRKAKARRMGDRKSKNVIPIRSDPPDDDASPMPLRDVVLLQIELCGSLWKHAKRADAYMRSRMSGLICAMADAGMPFDTWKDEISDDAIAGLRRMKVDLRPELAADRYDALMYAGLEMHPDWSKSGDDWEYHGDPNTPHYMNDVVDWFKRTYPDEAREIEQHFAPPDDSDPPPPDLADPPPAA